jgi:hypothetical protein
MEVMRRDDGRKPTHSGEFETAFESLEHLAIRIRSSPNRESIDGQVDHSAQPTESPARHEQRSARH